MLIESNAGVTKLVKKKKREQKYNKNGPNVITPTVSMLWTTLTLAADTSSNTVYNFQHSQDTFVGAIIPKVLSTGLVKLLIKTGLFHLIFRKFTKYTRLSLKEFLDDVSDNDTFKLFMSYAFGDLGRFIFCKLCLWGTVFRMFVRLPFAGNVLFPLKNLKPSMKFHQTLQTH